MLIEIIDLVNTRINMSTRGQCHCLPLASGTEKSTDLKLGTHLDRVLMYRIYWNQAAVAYSLLYFFIFLSLQFQKLIFFVTLLCETVRPSKLKLDIHMGNGLIESSS